MRTVLVGRISTLLSMTSLKDNFDGKTHFILKDLSTNGTAVSYSGQASEEVRHYFIWILDLEKEEGKWKIEVHV